MADDPDMKLNVDVKVDGTEKLEKLRTQEFGRIEAELLAVARAAKAAASGIASLGKGQRGTGASDATSAREALNVDRERFAELKRTWSFQRRMASQAKSESNEAARAVREEAREVERRFREQLAFNTRMAAQRAKAESDAEREIRREIAETTRMRDRANRQVVADVRRLEREQHRAMAGVAQGAGRVRSGAGRTVAVGGATGIGLAYGAERAVDALTRSGAQVDAALNSNIRLGGLSPRDAEVKGREIRAKAMPIARSLGIKTSEYLKGRAEAIQAGVDEEILDTVTEFGSKYARLNDMSSSEVMESSGYGITALGAFGKVTADKVNQLFNIQQHLAATTAASRQGLNAFVKRGLSAGAAAGFSIDDTLAYGGAATSSGADGEMAARMLSSTTERLASMPTKAADIGRKKHKSLKDRNILSLPRKLGFRDWREVKAAFSADAAGTMEKLYEGLATVHDPRERLELSEELWGKEFGAVHAAMAVGHRFRDMRKSVRSPQAGGAIDKGMAVRSGSYDFVLEQIGAVITDLKDSLGLVLKPLWSDLRDWTMKAPQAFGSFEAAFRFGLEGFLFGLGSPDGTLGGALRRWFGDPAGFRVNAQAMFDFAKGFATGLRDTAQNLRSLFSVLTGSDASAETIGRMTARFLSLSAACLALAPVMGVLGGLVTILAGLTAVAKAAGTFAAGAAGAGAGALAGVAKILMRGFVLGLAGEIGAHRGEISTMIIEAVKPLWAAIMEGLKSAFSVDGLKRGGSAILDEFIPAPLRRWWDGQGQSKPGTGSDHWVDPPLRGPIQGLTESLDKATEAIEESAKIHKQSYEAESFRDLIRPASLSTGAAAIGNQIRTNAIRAGGLSGSIGGGAVDFSGPALNHSIPGRSIGGGMSGMRRNGIIGGGSGSGGGNVDLGNGVTGPRMAGDVATRAKVAYDFFRSKGLSHEAAAGILASMKQESNFTPTARGDGGRAHGLFQHHPDRRAAILRGAGVNMSTASYDQQLAGTWWEMNNGDAGAQRALRILKTPGITARQAGAAFVQHFERPARDERASRGALAEGFARQLGSSASPVAGAQQSVQRLQTQGRAAGTVQVPGNPTPPTSGKPGLGELDVAPRGGAGLGSTTPLRSGGGGAGGRSAGGGTTINAPISITSHGGDAREVASQVPRHIQQIMDRRTHDTDGFA